MWPLWGSVAANAKRELLLQAMNTKSGFGFKAIVRRLIPVTPSGFLPRR